MSATASASTASVLDEDDDCAVQPVSKLEVGNCMIDDDESVVNVH